MNKFLGFTAALALLAACDQRPVDGDVVVDTGDEEPVGEVPVVENSQVAVGDLLAANYDPDGTNPLIVRVALDGGIEELQAYGLYPAGEIEGLDFEGYFYQDRDGTRFFRAFGGESEDGSVNAVVVSDGGQFNRFFGGAAANQISFSAPAGGLTTYSGQYVGLVNFGSSAGGSPAGTVNGDPTESFATIGEVYLVADFTEGFTEGEIYNRTFEPGVVLADLPDEFDYNDDTLALPEIVLVAGTIADDGSFTGGAELTQDGQFIGIGSYGGVFGGTDATSVAGVVRLGAGFLGVVEVEDPDNPGESFFVTLGDGNEVEFGVFILEDIELP